MTTKVLIVDDNEPYRTAFRRNLTIQSYDVVEAENAEEAVRVHEQEKPDIVVTDLSMRTPTEGLDLIRSIKQVDPLIPVVMISAVGTFEEGSLAKEFGAERVLTKQRIDEQIEELYKAIEQAKSAGARHRELRGKIESISGDPETASADSIAQLREIIATPGQHPVLLAEAYDALTAANAREIRRALEEEIQKQGGEISMEEIEAALKEELPELRRFAPETVKELKTAEYFFRRQGGDNPQPEADFSRNVGFSYCFAVENEAKTRLRRKLNRFLSDSGSIKMIKDLLDPKTRQLDLFYHQALLRLQQNIQFDFTIDNVRQVFQRILEHESRYKPDGLKALGIMIVCFGRTYEVPTMKAKKRIANPLNIKAFDSDDETLHFAHLLVSLQHYRNPYIHPEISDMEKVSKIRETAIECLKRISALT